MVVVVLIPIKSIFRNVKQRKKHYLSFKSPSSSESEKGKALGDSVRPVGVVGVGGERDLESSSSEPSLCEAVLRTVFVFIFLSFLDSVWKWL